MSKKKKKTRVIMTKYDRIIIIVIEDAILIVPEVEYARIVITEV